MAPVSTSNEATPPLVLAKVSSSSLISNSCCYKTPRLAHEENPSKSERSISLCRRTQETNSARPLKTMECIFVVTLLFDFTNTHSASPSSLYMATFGPVFMAAVLPTSYITAPGGLVQTHIETGVKFVPGATSDRVIPSLGAIYIFWTFALSGLICTVGQAAALPEGVDDHEPRKHVKNLVVLPLSMRSATCSRMEMFLGFALTAALDQAMAPKSQQIVNLLGLHVFWQCFVFYPCYMLK
jgi:hypothetical protein